MDEVVNPQGNIIMTIIELTDSPPREANWDYKFELNDILMYIYYRV
jgi:hypothetical protein